jgi:hypothetical protein
VVEVIGAVIEVETVAALAVGVVDLPAAALAAGVVDLRAAALVVGVVDLPVAVAGAVIEATLTQVLS